MLTDADQYVLKYLESISSQISSETLNALRQKLGVGTEKNQSNGKKKINYELSDYINLVGGILENEKLCGHNTITIFFFPFYQVIVM